MNEPRPILVTHLIPKILDALALLLEGLEPADWSRPTACSGWTVKDVPLHLLAVDISNIARKRDNHSVQPVKPVKTDQDLLEFVNSLNDSWMQATQRISTPLLIDLIRFVGVQANNLIASLEPLELGDPVSWVGSDPAPVWLDLAREYTERWHHQQHIRDAVGIPGLKESHFFTPIIETFVWALPYTYRNVGAPDGTLVTLSVAGNSGGQWSIHREQNQWKLYIGSQDHPTAKVTIDQEDAWRLFTSGYDSEEVRARSSIEGNDELCDKVFEVVSIIA